MLLSAIFHFSPKRYFSSRVCPEQLVSWSISEATKDPFEIKDFKSHISDFPELGAVAGEALCSLAVHMGTLWGCLPPLSPYWLSPLLLPVTIPQSRSQLVSLLVIPPSYLLVFFQFSFTSSQTHSNVQRRKYCYSVPSVVSHCHYSCFFRIASLGAIPHYVSKQTFTYLQGE